MKKPEKDFLDGIESRLCNVYVNRRVAELCGYDVAEIDKFIEERSNSLKAVLSGKSMLEMVSITEALAKMSAESISEILNSK